MLEQTKNEYKIIKKLSEMNKHIAAALDMKEFNDEEANETHIEILIEHGGKPLEKLLAKTSISELMPIIRQTLDAFNCMAENGIFHSDIKPKNIVMKDGIVKIIDFGMSKDLKEQTMLQQNMSRIGSKILVGIREYLPPELYRDTGKNIL